MTDETTIRYLERLRLIRVNRRHFLAGSALAATSMLLAACGGEDEDDDTPEASDGGEPTSASGAGAEPTSASEGDSEPTSAESGSDSGDTEKKTLTIGISADFTSLDPQLSTFNNDVQYSFNLFDNLIARHPDGKLYPMLATEWELVDDNTWEFKLRDDVTFHNGDPFTSADVKFTIERSYDPEAQTVVGSIFTAVETIETPDDYTVRFLTKEPDPLLDARLAFYGGQIIPKKHFEEVGADEFNLHPVGTGPVMFSEWVRDDHLTLEAFPDYWDEPIAFDTVIFKPIPELSSRVASVLAGESDIVVNLTPDVAEQVDGSDNAYISRGPYTGETVLFVNSLVPPLDNPKIRQALSLAIDREAIVNDLWRGMGSIANSPIPKTDSIGYDPDKPPYPYDPEQAKALLEEAGYDNEEIYIETTVDVTTNDKAMADAIVAMWQEVGINAVEEVIQLSVRAQKSADKSFKGMSWMEPTSTVGESDGMIWRHLGPGGKYRYTPDPEFDKLGAEAHTTTDATKREELYKQMVEIFDEQLFWIPILQPDLLYGVQNFIEWTPSGNFQLDIRAYNLKVKKA